MPRGSSRMLRFGAGQEECMEVAEVCERYHVSSRDAMQGRGVGWEVAWGYKCRSEMAHGGWQHRSGCVCKKGFVIWERHLGNGLGSCVAGGSTGR